MASPTDSVAPDAPTGSSTLAGAVKLWQWFAKITDWIKALSPTGASKYDTGWVTCTLSSGIAQQGGYNPRIRRQGKTVTLDLGVTSAGITASASTTIIDAIPAEFRPTGSNYEYRLAVCNTGDVFGRVFVSPAGAVQINAGSKVGSYYLVHITWTVD